MAAYCTRVWFVHAQSHLYAHKPMTLTALSITLYLTTDNRPIGESWSTRDQISEPIVIFPHMSHLKCGYYPRGDSLPWGGRTSPKFCKGTYVHLQSQGSIDGPRFTRLLEGGSTRHFITNIHFRWNSNQCPESVQTLLLKCYPISYPNDLLWLINMGIPKSWTKRYRNRGEENKANSDILVYPR